MSGFAKQAGLSETRAVRAARRAAGLLPAAVVGYSALIDPLINIGPVERLNFGGIQVGGDEKSTLATQLLIPALLGVAIFLALVARPRFPARLRPILLVLGTFLALALGSSIWSLDPMTTLKLAVYQSILCSLLALSVAVCDDPERVVRNVFWVFVAVVAANLAAAVLRPAGPIGHQGIYPYKNTLGGAAGCAFVFACFHVARGSLLQRSAAIASLAGALFLLVISESKTAIALAILAPTLAIALFMASRLARLSVITVAIGGLLLCAGLYLLASRIAGFDSSDLMMAVFGTGDFTGRTKVWEFVLSHIAESPFIGHGHRGFWGIGDLSPKHSSEIEFIRATGSSHSGYLDVLLDLGVLGLGLELAYVVGIIWLCGRFALRRDSHSMLYLAVVLFVLGRNSMESVILWSTFFDALCLIMVGFLAGYQEVPRPTLVRGAPARPSSRRHPALMGDWPQGLPHAR